MDRHRADEGVMEELRGPEQEGQELVVVQAPDAVRARRLQVVGLLDVAHEDQVSGEDTEHEVREVRWCDDAQLVETYQPDDEVQLVA